MAGEPGPRYLAVNGDESEPGTFKDRVLLATLPHLVIEGMVLAGLSVGARRGIIFLRHEYSLEQQALEEAITAFSGETVAVFAAGRTDAGVHALGQVAHVDIEKETDAGTVRDALNYHLLGVPVSVIGFPTAVSSVSAPSSLARPKSSTRTPRSLGAACRAAFFFRGVADQGSGSMSKQSCRERLKNWLHEAEKTLPEPILNKEGIEFLDTDRHLFSMAKNLCKNGTEEECLDWLLKIKERVTITLSKKNLKQACPSKVGKLSLYVQVV